jgi:predicted protein tyrosine phosphatase
MSSLPHSARNTRIAEDSAAVKPLNNLLNNVLQNECKSSSAASNPFPDEAEEILAIIKIKQLRQMRFNMQNDSEPIQILPGLFLGSIGAAKNLQLIKANKIGQILCIGKNIPLFHINNQSCQELVYKQINVLDGEKIDIQQYFEEAIEFIELAHQPKDNSQASAVLIHCFAGRSRSVTILLAYLLHCHYRNNDSYLLQLLKQFDNQVEINKDTEMLEVLLRFVQQARKEAQPNAGFMKQLKQYEATLKQA